MNNHQFVLEQANKRKTPSQIYQILKKYCWNLPTTIPLSTIIYIIRKHKWAGRKEQSPKKIESRPDFTTNQKIERSLNSNQTFSIRQISSDTGIALSTVHWILTNRMGYKKNLSAEHEGQNAFNNLMATSASFLLIFWLHFSFHTIQFENALKTILKNEVMHLINVWSITSLIIAYIILLSDKYHFHGLQDIISE